MSLGLYTKATIMIGETMSMDDQNVLTLLYQPIIGSRCYGIYMSLFSLLNRSSNRINVEHNFLTDLFSVSLNVFENERKKLEAIGLMNTYVLDDEYVYLLKTPLSARQFFNDGIMGIYLLDAVGENLFNNLVKKFQVEKFNRDGYKNITESFDNVFKDKVTDVIINSDGYFIDKRPNKAAKIGDIDFDFEVFLKGLSLGMLEKQNLPTGLEEAVLKTAYCYDLSEADMQQIYYRSLVDGNISFVKLTREAKLLSKNKKQSNVMNVSGIDTLRLVKPEDIIKILIDKSKIKREYYEVINKVVADSPYENEITNMVIFHAISKNKGVFPGYQYFMSAIDSFLKSKVKTFEDARAFVERQADYLKKEETEATGSAWLEEFKKRHKED